MDLPNILKQLHADLAKIKAAILTLELMEADTTRRRGRPPKWLTEAKRAVESKPRGARKPAAG
jgi:hypothetical protein